MMAFTEGKTNKDCSLFGGLGGMAENKQSGGCSHYMAGSMCLLVGISGGEGAKMRLLQRGKLAMGWWFAPITNQGISRLVQGLFEGLYTYGIHKGYGMAGCSECYQISLPAISLIFIGVWACQRPFDTTSSRLWHGNPYGQWGCR